MTKIILQATAVAALVFVLTIASLTLWRSFQPTEIDETHGTQHSETKRNERQEEKGFLERTTEDPIAFFTLWLTIFTGVLSVFTMWLALSTRDLRDFAEEQARDMKASIKESQRSADAARLSADAIASLERPYFFILGKPTEPINRGGSFDPPPVPRIKYEISNMGRVPGVLKLFHVRCFLHEGPWEALPVVEGDAPLRRALNPISGGATYTDVDPCEFDPPLSIQDWSDISEGKKIPTFMAIMIYEGALDFTYTDVSTYTLDLFSGKAYAVGENYNANYAAAGRISKGDHMTIPNVLWKKPKPQPTTTGPQ